MKKISIVLFSMATVVLLCQGAAVYAGVVCRKATEVYAVKGADTLRMDRYDTPSDTGLRPCVIFVFGGGFANGTR
ncbi:MAG: alpha/beta hydrolase, partial [Prevotellaceae bacterium]|nr:alpha/beta hydrolase [Prevotellaceae bacterium]